MAASILLHTRHLAAASVLGAVVFASLPAGAAEPPSPASPTPQFTDVTSACGVAEALAKHYRNVPKWWLSGMTLADLDGDGDLDLHLAGHGSPAAVAANDGRGSFAYVDPDLALPRGVRHDNDLPYPGGEIRLPLDFDEDGRIDLLCAWHDGGGVLYRNAWGRTGLPAGGFRRTRDLDVFCRGCASFDADRDGNADLLYDDGPRIAVRYGRGDGTFRPQPGAIPGSFQQSGFIPADVDGDGRIDLLMHGCTGGNFYSGTPFERRILRNEGDGKFADVTVEAGLDGRGGSIHGVGDVDHDGHPDLICLEGQGVAIRLNDGGGRFRLKAGAVGGLEPVRNRPHVLAWGGAVVTDLNNDGLADVLVVGRHFLYVLRGTGGGQLAYANEEWGIPNTAWSAVDEGLCFGDIDGDGRLDLIVCAPEQPGGRKGVVVLRNNLPGGHWLRVRPVGAPGNRAAAGATIRVFSEAAGGQAPKLLGCQQVCIWGRQSFHSYYAAAGTERHFGLGPRQRVDVVVDFHPSGKRVTCRGVRADTTVEVREEER